VVRIGSSPIRPSGSIQFPARLEVAALVGYTVSVSRSVADVIGHVPRFRCVEPAEEYGWRRVVAR
jgi:hypothetical protein